MACHGYYVGHRQKHRGPSHHYPPPSIPAPSSSQLSYNEDKRGVQETTHSGRPSDLQQQPPFDQPDAFGANSINLPEPYSTDQGGQGQQVTTPTQIR